MSVCEQFITSAPTNIMRKIKSLAFHEEFAVAEDEDASHGAVVEGVLLCADARFRDLYRLESAFLEAVFSDVLERVWQLDVLEILTALKCVILNPLQCRWEFDTFDRALLEHPVPQLKICIF